MIKKPQLLIIAASIFISGAFILASPVFADPQQVTATCNNGDVVVVVREGEVLDLADYEKACADHGGYTSPDPGPDQTIEETGAVDSGSDELNVWLNRIIDALTGLTGLIIVISLIFAGIQYMTARDNASQVSAAKNRILMTILAFFLYLMGTALLQWLVPGGVF